MKIPVYSGFSLSLIGRRKLWAALVGLLCLVLFQESALAHGVASGDQGYIQAISGINLLPVD